MSVQSVGQSSSEYWRQQLLASSSRRTEANQSSILSLMSRESDAADSSSATSSASSPFASRSSGSFNDILSALLNDDGTLSYDMETGSLVRIGQDGRTGWADMPAPMEGAQGPNLTTTVGETQNADGGAARVTTTTDAEGEVVRTETRTENADGSFSTVIAMTDPSGRTFTRTMSGEKTDDGFMVTSVLTDAEGHVLETGTELTADDGSVTRAVTRHGPDGGSLTVSESYDANGELTATTTTTTPPSTALAAADSTTDDGQASSASSSSATAAAASPGSASSASDSGDTTTTVTMTFTSEGIEQTTTVTDMDGNIVSQSTKEIPFSPTAEGEAHGSLLVKGQGLSEYIGLYATRRHAASQYGQQEASSQGGSQGGGLSVQA